MFETIDACNVKIAESKENELKLLINLTLNLPNWAPTFSLCHMKRSNNLHERAIRNAKNKQGVSVVER
jgi:hypothetical protein